MQAFIGLGSNLENPLQQIQSALVELSQLPQTKHLATSALYRSTPVGLLDQPDFINGVALLETSLSPLALLDALQALENQHRRVREIHWGPRTLDLDILLLGDLTLDEPRLKVPHPFLKERSFVLYPLADINPDLILPDGTPLKKLMASCSREGLTPIT